MAVFGEMSYEMAMPPYFDGRFVRPERTCAGWDTEVGKLCPDRDRNNPMLTCDKEATDFGAPIDRTCKRLAAENGHIYLPFAETETKIEARYRTHVPFCVNNVGVVAFNFSASGGKKYWVPTLTSAGLDSENMSSHYLDPVNPDKKVLDLYGYFTNDKHPNAIEHMTFVICKAWDGRINAWWIEFPNEMETKFILPMMLMTHPALTMRAPWMASMRYAVQLTHSHILQWKRA